MHINTELITHDTHLTHPTITNNRLWDTYSTLHSGEPEFTMYLVDLNCTRKTAFARGFWRGLGSPVVIFMNHHLPKEAEPVMMAIENPAAKSGGLRGDWVRVGEQLRSSAKAVNTVHG